jgi:hypothetical protein
MRRSIGEYADRAGLSERQHAGERARMNSNSGA